MHVRSKHYNTRCNDGAHLTFCTLAPPQANISAILDPGLNSQTIEHRSKTFSVSTEHAGNKHFLLSPFFEVFIEATKIDEIPTTLESLPVGRGQPVSTIVVRIA